MQYQYTNVNQSVQLIELEKQQSLQPLLLYPIPQKEFFNGFSNSLSTQQLQSICSQAQRKRLFSM